MIRVLVVDDHDLVRTGISRMLADIDGLQVVGQAESGEAAIKKSRELKPDVVLMDVKMPGIGGLEATRKLLLYHLFGLFWSANLIELDATLMQFTGVEWNAVLEPGASTNFGYCAVY